MGKTNSLPLMRMQELCQRRQPIAVLPDKPRELSRTPEAGDENARLGEQSEQPANVRTIGPAGDPHLIAGQKAEGGSDTMDRGTIIELFQQIEADLVLRSAANRNDNVPRVASPNEAEQRLVLHLDAVFWRDIE